MSQKHYDPNRLMRFVGRHALNGVMAGWTVMLALIWLDIGGVGTLLHGSPDRTLLTVMLAGAFGLTFSFIGILWGVMVVLPDEE